MAVETFTLDNGLRIIAAPSPTKVVYCGYAIAAGTRSEAQDEEGLAHFVEHLIFKGTERRRAWHILNRMESVGGDLNAFTNKEEVVVYSTFLEQHFGRALELLTDIVFHSTFPKNEMEKEADVVLEEIKSYEDEPSELIFDEFEEIVFGAHPLGRNILGNEQRLKSFAPEHAQRFAAKYYRPANAVLFVHGNVPMKKIVAQAQKLTATLTPKPAELPHTELPPYRPQQLVRERGTHQAHVLMGCRSYPARHERWIRLYLLNNLLGGPGMNSRLNVSLRERRGLVYNVESSLTTYTDAGLFAIYFGCEPHEVERCIALVHKELERLREKRLSPAQLSALKKQTIGQIGVASDNFESIALEMGKNWLHYNRYDTQRHIFDCIGAVTADQLWETACELFAPQNLSQLIYR